LSSYSISKLIENVLDGIIRIPAFQRGFVWKSESVAFLMDSLFRDYPVGNLLLWQTQEKLAKERDLGEFELPEPKKEWPIQYVLDGQQRITSVFSVFQTQLTPSVKSDWLDIYADLDADLSDRENLFLALPASKIEPGRHFALSLIFNGAESHKAILGLPAERQEKAIKIINRFKEVQLPYELIDLENKEDIAIVFERVNRAGVRLDTFQLLSAWTWSTEFDLRDALEELQEEIDPYGFGSLADDVNLFMKCCAAVVEGDAQIGTVVRLNGPKVRDSYQRIRNGITGAIDFLRRELLVVNIAVLPYPAMIVPLAYFFADDGTTAYHPNAAQVAELKRWFWRSCFSRRYSSGVGRAHAADIQAMGKLRSDPAKSIALEYHYLEPEFFLNNVFSVGSVNTKIFVIMLAQLHPISLLNGAKVNLDEVLQQLNRKEFHHIFPKNHLEKKGVEKDSINCLANFCFLSSGDNKKISNKDPSDYKKDIPAEKIAEICEKNALWPEAFDLQYENFIATRSSILTDISMTLGA
jgi:hypothetical protein